jgi:hypothetical protein
MSTYHQSIIELISFILSKGNDFINDIDTCNAYDKILRNYHQVNSNGEKVYRNTSRMKSNYRFTKDAWKERENIKNLYFEHLVPLKEIKSELRKLTEKPFEKNDIMDILNRTEIVVLTRKEAEILNKSYKSKCPNKNLNRLEILNFEIESQTKNNSIFKNKKQYDNE